MTNNSPETPQDRRNEYREFDPTVIGEFIGSREIAASERISTGKSNTNFRLDLNDGQRVVVRLYSENAVSSPAREKYLSGLIGDLVPVPEMLAHSDDWAVFEFIEGDLLAHQPEHAAEAAGVIARLSQIRFDSVGWITESGDIAPFDFGDDYFGLMLEKQEVRNWLGPDRLQVLSTILANEKARLAEINSQPSLTHGDFNPTNVLIRDGAVSAVLDWEWSHAGTAYMDIGNLLRNIDPQFHESVRQGLVEIGFDLPGDWKKRAALIDVGSHLEFLTSSRNEDFKRSRVELIDSFIKMFRN